MRAPQYRRVTEPRSPAHKQNLDDLHDAIHAAAEAQEAMRQAMAGRADARDLILFKLDFARGRLVRICARISKGGDDAP